LACHDGALAAGALIDSIGLTATTAAFGCVYLAVTLIPAVLPLYKKMSQREDRKIPVQAPPSEVKPGRNGCLG
jgi:hypothetical protein